MNMSDAPLDASSLPTAEMHAAVGELLLQEHESCPVVLSILRPDHVVTLLPLDSLEPRLDDVIGLLLGLGWTEEHLTKLSEVLDARQRRSVHDRP